MSEPEGRGTARRSAPPGPFAPLPEWAGPTTRLVHGARRPERNAGAVVPPIYQTSTFRYPSEYSEAEGPGGAYLYTRYENPTQEVAAELVRDLEGGGAARVFGSGMGAIATTLLALTRPGDEVLAAEGLYGGTVELLGGLLSRFGVHVRWVTAEEALAPERCVGPQTRVLYLETPSNPTLRVLDLARWAQAADGAGAVSVVDNTFATPVNQRPLDFGIDVVLHSATKYLGGHSDLVGGVAVGPAELIERVRDAHLVLGSVLDPFAAFLLARGLRTLGLRVERQSASAAELATRLEGHPGVQRVWYPGRGGASEEAIAARQMRGRGGVVTFSVPGGAASAHALLHRLRLVQVAASLGGVESLVSLPRETSHARVGAAERARLGIDDGMIRLSVGIEEVDDLWRDLDAALRGAAGSSPAPL